MRNLTFKLGVLAAVTAVMATGAAARDLTVVSWGGAYQDAQREVYFKPFMATGVKMAEESWDGGVGTLRAKVRAATTTGTSCRWSPTSSDRLRGRSLRARLGEARRQGQVPAGRGQRCGVGAIVYSFVLAYDGDKIKTDPPKNGRTFNLQKWPGKRALRKGPKTTLESRSWPMAWRRRTSTRRSAPTPASNAPSRSSTRSRAAWSGGKGAQPPRLLASGEVVMTGVQRPHRDRQRKDKKTSRSCGPTISTIDSWVIMKGTPNKADAGKVPRLRQRPAESEESAIEDHLRRDRQGRDRDDRRQGAADLATAPQNISAALYINDKFWLENLDKLNQPRLAHRQVAPIPRCAGRSREAGGGNSFERQRSCCRFSCFCSRASSSRSAACLRAVSLTATSRASCRA